MRKLIFTLAAAGLLTVPALAQTAEKLDPAALVKIKDEGLNRSRVMETAFYLTDVCSPCLAGSEGLARANAWTKKRLTDCGLANATVEAWGDFGRGWDIDKSYAAMTVPYYHTMIGAPKAWMPATPSSLRKAVAYVNVKTVADLSTYQGQLRDKIVILPVATLPTPNFEPAARRLSAEDLQKLTGAPASGAPTAANRPAEANRAALLAARELRQQTNDMLLNDMLLAEGAATVLSPSRGTDGIVFTTNGAPYAADAKPVLPELEMSSEDQLRLIRLVEAGVPVEVELETKTHFQTQDLKGYNVVVEIPGIDKKLQREVVMLGGHFDSGHAATGATDNAASVAVMMEAVRILKAIGLKPRRTIRITLWGEAEKGLHGSRNHVI